MCPYKLAHLKWTILVIQDGLSFIKKMKKANSSFDILNNALQNTLMLIIPILLVKRGMVDTLMAKKVSFHV